MNDDHNIAGSTQSFAVIGRGRLGSALATAMQRGGLDTIGPLGRNPDIGDAHVVVLCVPDSQIATVAASIPNDRLLAHCSGMMTLEPLAPHEAFSMHPLLTVTETTTDFSGVGCATQATSARAHAACSRIVTALGMRSFTIAEELRPLYHAAASAASNYVVTVASFAETLMAHTGVSRELLLPLVRAAAENWARDGARALTGPIQRGDTETVARQRAAVAVHAGGALALWDALAEATRALASRTAAVPHRGPAS